MFKHCTEVHFASFLSSGFTTMKVINPPESNLAKRTSVHWLQNHRPILSPCFLENAEMEHCNIYMSWLM